MYRLAIMRRGYPLAVSGEFIRSQHLTLETALEALGEHVPASGYAGTFNPRHPAATDYFLVARSTKDSSLVVVTDTEDEA